MLERQLGSGEALLNAGPGLARQSRMDIYAPPARSGHVRFGALGIHGHRFVDHDGEPAPHREIHDWKKPSEVCTELLASWIA